MEQARSVSSASASAETKRKVEGARGEVDGASFGQVLRALGQRVDRGEAVMRRALHSDMGGLDARALIAVQAGIYHYTEAIELAGKLVDRATNAVRTVLQPGGH